MKQLLQHIANKIGYTLAGFCNKILLKSEGVKQQGKITIYGKIRLKIKGELQFGDRVLIRSSWRSNPAGGGQTRTLLCICNGSRLSIGNNVGISNSSIFCSKGITIEDDVMIGVNCIIMDTDHHSIYYCDRMNGNIGVKSEKIIIKKGAWICGNCIILKGVTIGEKAVLGAGSVLTHSIPDGELWAGNPARFIKKIE